MKEKDWVLLTDQAGDLYDRLKEVLPCSSPLLERAYQRYRRRQSKQVSNAVIVRLLKVGDKVKYYGRILEVYDFNGSSPRFRENGNPVYVHDAYFSKLQYVNEEDRPSPKAVVSSTTPRVLKVEKISVFAGGKKYVPNWQVKVIANGLVLQQFDKEHLAYECLGKLEKRVSEIGIQELIKEVRSAEVS